MVQPCSLGLFLTSYSSTNPQIPPKDLPIHPRISLDYLPNIPRDNIESISG